MYDKNKNNIKIYPKEEIDEKLRNSGISLRYKGYDAPYIYCMVKADFPDIFINDSMISKFIKGYIDDPDGYESVAFNRFYADTIAKGIPIIWEDML